MKYINNKVYLLFLAITITLNVSAGTNYVESAFTYQGQLLINNSPADGVYDVNFELHRFPNTGSAIAVNQLTDVNIIGGLISVDLDFGDAAFTGEERFLQISIKPTGDPGGHQVLSPRQRINATPYAIQAEFVKNGATQWDDISTGINYPSGNVTVASGDLEISAGDVAVTSGNLDISNGDVAIPNGKIILGSGVLNNAKLQVFGDAGLNALRVKVDGFTKLTVHANGGTTIGDSTIQLPRTNSVYVSGDAVQGLTSHGFVKAGVEVNCAGPGTALISSFNNINSDDITIATIQNNIPGNCTIALPFSPSDVFVVTSSELEPIPGTGIGPTNVNCRKISSNNTLFCQAISFSFPSNSISLSDANITVLFY